MQKSSYHFSWQKRTFDVCLSCVLLAVLFPVFCGVILLVLVSSGFPVFFWQERMGHQKKPFKMLKFRTMHPDAETLKKKLAEHNEAPFPMFKMNNDPRFTKVGRFLSRTGLDELPQFFHILTGKMSFIGPRPLPVHESKQLPRSWDFRYAVKPGILSEWAVAPDRYASLKRWRQLELETLKNSSLVTDIRLILRSFVFLLKGNATSFLDKGRVRASRALPRVVAQGSAVSGRKRTPAESFA